MAILYRIVQYDGPEDWLDCQLDGSLPPGEKTFPNGAVIRVAPIDPDDEISVSIARNKMRQIVASLATKEAGDGA